jgi:hypothetical protein
MLIPRDQEEITSNPKLRKSVLSSNPGDGGSCSSEKTTIEECQDQISCVEEDIAESNAKTPKTVLMQSPGVDDLRSPENNHDGIKAP